jgi:hypothetical protein
MRDERKKRELKSETGGRIPLVAGQFRLSSCPGKIGGKIWMDDLIRFYIRL